MFDLFSRELRRVAVGDTAVYHPCSLQPFPDTIMWLVLVLLAGVLAQPLDILSLANAPLRAGPPPGWKVRNVRGQDAPEIEIRNDGEGPVLRIQGAGRAAWFYRELPTQLTESPGSLT